MITKLDKISDISTEFGTTLASAKQMSWFYNNKNPDSPVQPVMGGGKITDWIGYDHSATNTPTVVLCVGTKNYTTNNYIETWRFEPEKPGSAEHGRQYVMNNRFVYLNFYRSFVDGSSFTAQTQSLYSIDSKWVFNIGTTYNFNGYWSKRITSIQIFGIAFMNYNTH